MACLSPLHLRRTLAASAPVPDPSVRLLTSMERISGRPLAPELAWCCLTALPREPPVGPTLSSSRPCPWGLRQETSWFLSEESTVTAFPTRSRLVPMLPASALLQV